MYVFLKQVNGTINNSQDLCVKNGWTIGMQYITFNTSLIYQTAIGQIEGCIGKMDVRDDNRKFAESSL
jgi:hypothetical protein